LGPVPAAFEIKVSVNVPSSSVVAGELSDTPTLVFWVGTSVAARPVKLIDGVTIVNVRVKSWVAFGRTPLEAVMVIGKLPPVFAAGAPLNSPVAVLNVTPPGSAPLSLNVGAGKPVTVTVKEQAVLTVHVVLLALVMAGAWSTVRVKFWVAFGRTPLLAVIVIG
jgi:hypothetical protein